MLVLLAPAAFLATEPGPLAAQKSCDRTAGTLGIQGMRCEGCTFRMSRSGIEEARFRTEPEVLAVARGFTEGDEVRVGDRIVSLDGVLVTTRAGGNALARIRAGQRLVVRVRRDGRMQDLDLVAGSACALREAVDEREVEVERALAPLPPGAQVVELPPPPGLEPMGAPDAPEAPEPGAVVRPAAPGPALPLAGALGVGPSGYLGFGFRCSQCAISDGHLELSGPMVVEGVRTDGPAERAGLRSGDRVIELDGVDITTDMAGRRFGAIQPGDTVRLTVTRGESRRVLTVVATERVVRPAPLPPLPTVPSRVRFDGRLGDVRIEVQGGVVEVDRDEDAGEIVIRTRDAVIRLRREGG